MPKNVEQQIVYKKSWLKLSLIWLSLIAMISVCVAGIMADNSPPKWIMWLVLLAALPPLTTTFTRLILPTFLLINKEEFNWSGKKQSWHGVHQIVVNHTNAGPLFYYTIHIVYGEQTAKPLMYYLNGKKTFPLIIIYAHQLNAPTLEIYDNLIRYHQQYCKESLLGHNSVNHEV